MSYRLFTALTSLIITILLNPCLSFSQVRRSVIDTDTDFLLPERMTLCGETVPLDDPWVWEMLDREVTITAWDREQTFMYLKRAGRYFPFIETQLAEEDMPDDLKYLVVAESALIPSSRSSQGAVGLWQFMTDTAKKIGLRSDKYIDERRGLEESTEAALIYLKKLKEMFGTWSLAMAAYNCGDNRLKREIKDQQESDFYNLKLPPETERYIFRIAAIKIIMEKPEAYGYQVPETKVYREVKCDRIKVTLKKAVHITDFAKAIGTTFKAVRNLNPKIIDDYLPSGSYELNTPPGTGKKAQEFLSASSSKSAAAPDISQSKQYVVQQGDTLSSISKKTGVPIDRIKELNNLKGSMIKTGEVLSIE